MFDDDLDMRKGLERLKELSGLDPDEAELHRLLVMFRHHRPARKGVLERIAEFVHGSTPAPSVRGEMRQQLLEYQAGPASIMMELKPNSGGSSCAVHGQLFAEGIRAGCDTVVISWGDERQLAAELDEFGEFDIDGIPPGRYRITWHLKNERIVLRELKVLQD